MQSSRSLTILPNSKDNNFNYMNNDAQRCNPYKVLTHFHFNYIH